MELVNAKYYDESFEEVLIADFRENNEIMAQLTISKDDIDFNNPNLNFDNKETISEALISNNGPYPQTITIISHTAKDPYTESPLSLKKDHDRIISQVGAFITNITGLTPTYTKDSDDSEVEPTEKYNAIVKTEVNIITTIIDYLKANNVAIEEEVHIIDEEPLIKEEARRRI